MIRIGLRMREDVNSGPATQTAVPAMGSVAPDDTRHTGSDGLCEGCGAAWPCVTCGDNGRAS